MPSYYTIIISGYKETCLTTLRQVLQLQVCGDLSYEVVMLDNTRDGRHAKPVAACFKEASTTQAVRTIYLHQAKPGKAEAQNIGIRQARGTHIIFIDDDVVPNVDLIQQYDEAFKTYDCAAVQGRVELMFVNGAQAPVWLDKRFRLDLAEMDFGTVIIPFEMGLTGANMAFRADIFLRHGHFDERFGPGRCGTLEDQEFSERIRAAGEIQVFWPGASVRHMIPPERTTVKSFASIHYDVGYSDFFLSRHLIKGGLLRLAFYQVRKGAIHSLHCILNLIIGRQANAIWHYCEIHRLYAYWLQARRMEDAETCMTMRHE